MAHVARKHVREYRLEDHKIDGRVSRRYLVVLCHQGSVGIKPRLPNVNMKEPKIWAPGRDVGHAPVDQFSLNIDPDIGARWTENLRQRNRVTGEPAADL